MATVYIIQADKDMAVMSLKLLPVLPSNGYSHYLERSHFVDDETNEKAIFSEMEGCQAILIVISNALFESSTLVKDIEIALDTEFFIVVIETETIEGQNRLRLPGKLWLRPMINLALEELAEAQQLLVGLLPSVSKLAMSTPANAELIQWDAQIFSAVLYNASKRHDHAQMEFLVAVAVDHFKQSPTDYPIKQAYEDLQALRQARDFELMFRYGEAIVTSKKQSDGVRRLFAQALIETGKYDHALEVLQSIINDSASSSKEIFEARGLVGRVYKQLYVNAPSAEGAFVLLRKSIDAYKKAYLEDRRNFWHGVNAVSCMLRAQRDGIEIKSVISAREIALQIVDDLNQRLREGPLEIWDSASLVEALLAIGKYDEAQNALEVYIHHPDMTAFEVSSTFRQYKQVLELDRNPNGAPLLDSLRRTMERYRAGKALNNSGKVNEIKKTGSNVNHLKSLIIRVCSDSWNPVEITDLTIQTQLGKVFTGKGSEKSIQELLADPMVISVEESRTVGKIECDKSMPFINVGQHYMCPAGTYEETGDCALIAIIDDSIDVLHKAFLDGSGNSRIVAIWDQTDVTGTPPNDFDYGKYYDQNAIAELVKTGFMPLGLVHDTQVHGTHVSSIAAGRAAGSFAGGVAPDAKVVIVISAGSGPIGYSQCHIEALSLIDKLADKLKLPVVVNVSQGMNAGAHDGKSALEAAFDAFSQSGRKTGRVVVKSAGNERDKAGHAKIMMSADALERLRWKRQLNADIFERIELWWDSDDEMQFRLRAPGFTDEWSEWTGTDAPECNGTFPNGGGAFSMKLIKRHVDNGDSMLLIELGSMNEPAAIGEWMLEIHSREVRGNGEVHCWIERGAGLPTMFQNHAYEEMTLSIPGTARSVISVGAVGSCKPLQVGEFSSYGPTRDKINQPVVCAPGMNISAAEAGTVDGVMALSGTSMAAPHVAGAIALVLSRAAKRAKELSSNQIACALRQKTQNYSGRWNPGQGYGLIDVSAFLAAFE